MISSYPLKSPVKEKSKLSHMSSSKDVSNIKMQTRCFITADDATKQMIDIQISSIDAMLLLNPPKQEISLK